MSKTEWEQFREERLKTTNQKQTAENEATYQLKNDIDLAMLVAAKILKPAKTGIGFCCPICDYDGQETGNGVHIAKYMQSANFYCPNCKEHGTIFTMTAWRNHHPTPQRTDYEMVYFHAAKFLPFLQPYVKGYQDTVLLQTR